MVSKLAFLTETTSHMSDFNTKSQGSNQIIYELYQYI